VAFELDQKLFRVKEKVNDLSLHVNLQ